MKLSVELKQLLFISYHNTVKMIFQFCILLIINHIAMVIISPDDPFIIYQVLCHDISLHCDFWV